MTTFGLVHGAWHGAWCWENLGPELERLGHRVATVELPGDDPSASFSTYADVIVSALAEEQGDLVLVGHSMAGLTIPVAAARLPVRRAVFLCALIADPGRSFADQLESEPEMLMPGYDAGLSLDEQGRGSWSEFDEAWKVLFGDCDETLARSAFDRLRPQARTPYGEPCPLESLPDVERSYIWCSDDHLVNPEWAPQAARDRLGIEPVQLPGSHSPFLSRPAQLARLLDDDG